MSHWQTSKVSLKCSLNVLKRALINIMPEWEKNIQADEAGTLKSVDNAYGESARSGYHLVVKLSNKDIGFKKQADGSWAVDYDSYVLPRQFRGTGGLEGALTQEYTAMHVKEIARLQGNQVLADNNTGDVREIRILVPEGIEV